jgi:hypothetical protein
MVAVRQLTVNEEKRREEKRKRKGRGTMAP